MLSSHVLLDLPNLAFRCVALLLCISYSRYPGFESGLGCRIFWILWFSLVARSKSWDSTWLGPRPLPSTLLTHLLFIISLYTRSCRFRWPRRLRPLACWYCVSNPARVMDVCLLWVLCSQVEVSALGWSLVQRSPTECGVSGCDCEYTIMRRPWTTRGCCVLKLVEATIK